MERTHYCGALRREHIGQTATVCGWALTCRDMGGVIFVDVRDREGTLQTVFDLAQVDAQSFAAAERLKNQSVVKITGEIRLRDESTYNPALPTGEIELAAAHMEVLSASDTLPFSLTDDEPVREDLRLKYRYLDLRRPQMYRNLLFRHNLIRQAQRILDEDGFLQVETPVLCKSTPEGARDYLVPSRVHPGTFYALPQSPQIYKQLLMVSGIDKYYQVARCFRDEDLRADRQPEFTQLDMERSFVDQEDMLDFLKNLFSTLFERVMGRPIPHPFKRLTWQTAMDVYGNDKPDLRFDLPIVDVSDIADRADFAVFTAARKAGGVVRCINVKGAYSVFTRSTIDLLTNLALKLGAKGMAWILYKDNGEINSIMPKYFRPEVWKELETRMGAQNGDFLLFCADELDVARRVLSGLRVKCADLMGLIDKNDFQFALVTDFPMFEYKKDEQRFAAMHHPFTMPFLEDVDLMFDDATKPRVRSQAYDVVLNGVELGSGSVRIHRGDIQAKVFRALGFEKDEARDRFGFLLDAFRFGTPPHAGFAFGIDRLCMLLTGAPSLREVIAFPKTKDASCLLTGAPDYVDASQLEALKLGVAVAEEGKAEHERVMHRETVKNTAQLAMLTLSAEEETRMSQEFNAIVDFAGELAGLQREAPKQPRRRPDESRLRPDEPGESLPIEAVLQNATTVDGRLITVPRTFE
ncbi:MAG: aspartate--tRNA ligase [Clostridiales bacterium]|nr:aspartate--tRNA ligase [Clostridiales bacterium]MDO4350332.1 aspartate--tRNA ligase [Eubacteriales bacterium]MDY4008696.1 aspartate--tRNA ligase [Candidatus Limiplasma sp.]